MSVRPFFCLLLATAISHGGEYFRFDASVGPGKRAGSLHGFAFDEQHEKLRVIDREAAQEPKWTVLGEAFTAVGAVAGCNGGYSTPDGKAIGLVIVDSRRTGEPDPRNSLANGLLLVKPGSLKVIKAAAATETDLAGVTQALQAGPLLVEDGKPAAELDAKSYARHTVLLGSGTGQWAILYVPSATADGLARLLADGTSFPKFKVSVALNLGTGLSSALWLARTENALPLYLKEVDPVRGGIAVVAK